MSDDTKNGCVADYPFGGLKTLCPFWFGIGYVFRGLTTGVYMYECIYRFQFEMNKNETEICEFEMHLKNFLFAL